MKIGHHTFLVYIGNLPNKASKQWLCNLFARFGAVSDAFLSKKSKRPSSLSYAFVWFLSQDGARKAIDALNGEVIDGNWLVVVVATMRKSESQHCFGEKSLTTPATDFHHFSLDMEGILDSSLVQKGMSNMPVIQGVESNSWWLDRSLVLDTSEQLNTVLFARLAKATWENLFETRELSSIQFLITFCSFEAMLSALQGGVRPVSSFCSGLRKWSLDAWSFSRLAWVEVFELPPSAWSNTNLISIGKIWGKVRGFDERIVKGSSFGSARMLIDTCFNKDPINGHVVFVLGVHHL